MVCTNKQGRRSVTTFERNLCCTVVCDYEELQFDNPNQSFPNQWKLLSGCLIEEVVGQGVCGGGSNFCESGHCGLVEC